MILGDMRGRRAGEMGTEEPEERFLEVEVLELRAARRGVFRSEAEEEENLLGRICGDCVADLVDIGLMKGEALAEPEPALRDGARTGVRDSAVGVGCLGKWTESGSSKFSMWSIAWGSWLPPLLPVVRVLGELSFISDAGVAGDGMPPGSMTWPGR